MTWIASLWRSLGVQIAVALAFIGTAAAICAQVFLIGKKSATAETLKRKLQDKALEAKVNAEIDAISASTRRKQLRNRWSKQ